MFLLGGPFPAADRTIAITLDDLPYVGAATDVATQRANTALLFRPLLREHVPVTGFVVGQGFDRLPADARHSMYQMWQRAGFELGNHTWTHANLDTTPLTQYEAEILRTDAAMKENLGVSHVRYFRAPYLNEGKDAATKAGLRQFLDDHGFTEAPVTLDTEEWRFATPYDRALQTGDRRLARRIEEAYVPYMESLAAYFEAMSREVLGRECAQIYLLHVNRLTAKTMPRLLKFLRRRHYRFISLTEALQDPAYRRPDGYEGSGGYSWLIRWALADQKPLPDFPSPPKWLPQ